MPPLLSGLLIGFSIAAPVGPIGVLCLRRSLADGRLAGFVSGLGAATADALYGVVAAFGLTVVTSVLLTHRAPLQLGGGAFLLYLGVATLRAKPREANHTAAALGGATAHSLRAAYLSLFALTLANPLTILTFLGIFAGLGVGETSVGAWPAFRLVLGVFLGSAGWWLLLSCTAGWLGRRLQHGGLRGLHLASGVVIAGFGAWQLASLI